MPQKPRPKPAAPKATKRGPAKAASGPRAEETAAGPRAAPTASETATPAQNVRDSHAPAGDTATPAVRLTDAEAISVYLDDLADHGQYTRACAATGRHYSFIQRRRKSHPEFVAAEAEALASAPDMIRSEIARRAMEGTVHMTRYGPRREYDNALMLRYAEYMETGSWRQRQQVEMGAPGAFRTRAELQTAIESREAELAKARAEIAAEEAREMGLLMDSAPAPEVAM